MRSRLWPLREFRRRKWRISSAALLIVQPPEVAFDHSAQLFCGAIDGVVQGFRLMSDCNGCVTLKAGFDHAAFVVLAAFVAALVAQVNFYPRDVMADPAQSFLHGVTDPGELNLVSFNIVVGIYLDLHGVLLLWMCYSLRMCYSLPRSFWTAAAIVCHHFPELSHQSE